MVHGGHDQGVAPSSERHRPLACVMGDTDLVRPLAQAGVPCVVVNAENHLVAYSRHTRTLIPGLDAWNQTSALVERLLDFARVQDAKPVLFYQADADLLLVSRHRGRLAEGFELLVPDAELVEDLVDKARFHRLASQLGLPVPKSMVISAQKTPEAVELTFPVVVKPLVREEAVWSVIGSHEKAILFESWEQLRERWPRFAALGADVLVQEVVPGPEHQIESYHAYIDATGNVAGEFTGRKIRTLPLERGHSTAIEITASEEVTALGRDVLAALGLRGVAKVDFKRGPDRSLSLLEVNPRFTLWNNPGSVAGANLPAMVYADLAGRPRPRATLVRPGVRWCELMSDKQAARLAGIGRAHWLWWALRCETKHAASWDDPLPFLRKLLLPYVVRRLRRWSAFVRRDSRAVGDR